MRVLCLICILCFYAVYGAWTPAFSAQNTLSHTDASLEAMVGQMIVVGFRGMGYGKEDNLAQTLRSIRQGHVGGVVFFNYDVVLKSPQRNVSSLKQVTMLTQLLQKDAPVPLFIAIDQEGGAVRRLRKEHGTPFDLPSAQNMGTQSPDKTRIWGEKTGELLHSLGINVNFAPVVDVNVYPQSPAIGKNGRSFSADPHTVAQHARAFAEGLAKHNIIATYKHFPGHGSAIDDTHYGMADVTRTWTEKELIPYTAPLRPQVPLMIMTGHLFHRTLDPNYPSTMSHTMITHILRNTLQWDGVVASDDLQMQALSNFFTRKESLRLAILAGVDLFVLGNNLKHNNDLANYIHEDIMELVREGHISEQRIRESYLRIMRLKEQAGIL